MFSLPDKTTIGQRIVKKVRNYADEQGKTYVFVSVEPILTDWYSARVVMPLIDHRTDVLMDITHVVSDELERLDKRLKRMAIDEVCAEHPLYGVSGATDSQFAEAFDEAVWNKSDVLVGVVLCERYETEAVSDAYMQAYTYIKDLTRKLQEF